MNYIQYKFQQRAARNIGFFIGRKWKLFLLIGFVLFLLMQYSRYKYTRLNAGTGTEQNP